jgi:hypothetical protein
MCFVAACVARPSSTAACPATIFFLVQLVNGARSRYIGKLMTAVFGNSPPGGGPPAISIVRDAWLFTRGHQSIRIVRAVAGACLLLSVHGPGSNIDTRTFDDVISCMRYQADIERHLVTDGFSLERFLSDRRNGADRRSVPRQTDRRGLHAV